MKIGAIPETLLERLAMVFGLVPIPFMDTFQAVIVARAVMVATKLDVFDGAVVTWTGRVPLPVPSRSRRPPGTTLKPPETTSYSCL
jgi:hypothetical protein